MKEVKTKTSTMAGHQESKGTSPSGVTVEEDLSYVTEQLQLIQETQDSILNSLRTDIDVVQAENTLLNQKNQLLQ